MSNFQTNIKMDVRDNNQLVKVEEFNNIMRSAPAVLQRNQTSVSACNQAGQALLDTIEAAGGINTDELDTALSTIAWNSANNLNAGSYSFTTKAGNTWTVTGYNISFDINLVVTIGQTMT